MRDSRFRIALELALGASVGVTVSQASDVDEVLREADIAMSMSMAKANGEGRFELAATSASA